MKPVRGLRWLEAVLVGTVGAGLGGASVWVILQVFPSTVVGRSAMLLITSAAGVSGLNGAICGSRQVYRWSGPSGWLAFLADSTWGQVGTALSDVMHLLGLFFPARVYRTDLSRRHNRHVYEGGWGLGDIALTLGNLVRMLPTRVRGTPPELVAELVRHETLHITQSRVFGPIFQATFVLWLLPGLLVGAVLGLFVKQPLGQSIMDVAYFDNPWETWAWRAYGPERGKHHGGLLSWA